MKKIIACLLIALITFSSNVFANEDTVFVKLRGSVAPWMFATGEVGNKSAEISDSKKNLLKAFSSFQQPNSEHLFSETNIANIGIGCEVGFGITDYFRISGSISNIFAFEMQSKTDGSNKSPEDKSSDANVSALSKLEDIQSFSTLFLAHINAYESNDITIWVNAGIGATWMKSKFTTTDPYYRDEAQLRDGVPLTIFGMTFPAKTPLGSLPPIKKDYTSGYAPNFTYCGGIYASLQTDTAGMQFLEFGVHWYHYGADIGKDVDGNIGSLRDGISAIVLDMGLHISF